MNAFRPRPLFARRTEDVAPDLFTGQPMPRTTTVLPAAAAVVDHLPAAGGAVHAVMTGRYDLVQLLAALIDRLGTVTAMRVSTLSFHGTNLATLLAFLDAGQVRTLTLLCCTYFRNCNRGLFGEALREFRQRGQRVAAARTHAKVITLAFASGRYLTIEGSANLRHNDCWENITLIDDQRVHDFHADWLDQLVTNHEGDEDNKLDPA